MEQRNEAQTPAPAWETLKTSHEVRGARHKCHVSQDFTEMKCLEWAHSYKQNAVWWLAGVG